MANSKIPNVALTDTFNTQRRRFNQLLDSVGDVSTLETIATDITSAVNENHNRLDSINTVELLSPRMTLSDASATNNIAGDLILSNALTVQDSAYITGNLYVGGNLTVDGIANLKAGADNNINLGDGTNDTDTVTFKANIASHLIPNGDNTYDLGSADSEWRHAYFDGTVNADNLAADSATIGTLKVSDLTDNRVVISGASGEIEDDANLTFDGSRLVVGAAGADVTGMDADSATMGTAKVTDLTNNRVVIAGTNGELEDDTNLTYDGTDLSTNSLIVTDLTNNRVVIAGTGGAVEDDANLTYDGTDLSTNSLIVGDLTDNRVVIAGTSGAIEDDANLTFDGTTFEVGAKFDVVASSGNTIIGGTFDVTGATNLNNTTQATNTTSGALIVDGGVGVAKNAYVGGLLNVAGSTTLSDLAVNGGDLTTTVTTFNLINANATTVSFAGAGTSIDIGAASGTTSINNNLDVDLDLNVDGGDITTNQSSFNLLNTNATTINFGSAATTINIGDEIGGNTTIRQNLIVDSSLTVRGDFNVAGDFVVTGNQKNVAAFTVMNSGVAVNDANRAGLAVDRPSSDSAVVQWNELGNYWEVGTVNTDAGGGTTDVKQIARQHDSATFTNLYQTGTGATRIPSGTTAERPTARRGQIRYNTTLSAFEGYSGSNWGSLGGLIDVDQDTYVLAERVAASDSDTLQFVTADVLRATLNADGLRINQTIRSLNGGQLALRSDSGDNGSARITFNSFNATFDEGTLDALIAKDIDLRSLYGDVVMTPGVGGTNRFFVGDKNSDTKDHTGLVITPDAYGGSIRAASSIDSAANPAYIDFFDQSTANVGASATNKITYFADSHVFQGSGIHVYSNDSSKFLGPVNLQDNVYHDGVVYIRDDARFLMAADSLGIIWDKSTNSFEFKDNVELWFGDGNDLKIYHNENASYIEENGIGGLYILGSDVFIKNSANTATMADFASGGKARLWYDGAVQLETNADGVKIFNDLTVNNNLTVSGTTTTVNTETINLADNIILLNSNATGIPASINDGGIEIERGSYDNVQLLWDESEKYWVAATDSDNTLSRVATANWINGGAGLTFNSTSGEISHNDTSSVADVTSDNSGNTFIQDVTATFDSFGHVTGFSVDTNTVAAVGVQAQGGLSVDSSSNLSIDSDQIRQHIEPINFVGGLTANSLRSNDSDLVLGGQSSTIVYVGKTGKGGEAPDFLYENTGPSTAYFSIQNWANEADSTKNYGTLAFTVGDDSTGGRADAWIAYSNDDMTTSHSLHLAVEEVVGDMHFHVPYNSEFYFHAHQKEITKWFRIDTTQDSGNTALEATGSITIASGYPAFDRDITLDATGDIILDANGDNDIIFKNGSYADSARISLNLVGDITHSTQPGADWKVNSSNEIHFSAYNDTTFVLGASAASNRSFFLINDSDNGHYMSWYFIDDPAEWYHLIRGKETSQTVNYNTSTLRGDYTISTSLAGSIILDADSDITLDAGGNNIYFKNGGGADTWTWTLNTDATGSFATPDNFDINVTGDLTFAASYIDHNSTGSQRFHAGGSGSYTYYADKQPSSGAGGYRQFMVNTPTSATAVDDIQHELIFQGSNGSNLSTDVARIKTVFTDVTHNAEYSKLQIFVEENGANSVSTSFHGSGVQIHGGLYVGDSATPSFVQDEIRAEGDITAFYSSDITLKENIVEIDGAMDKINSIRGVYFDWTDEHIEKHGGEDGYFVRKHDVGVIAQEVEQVLPEVVRDRKDGTKAVDYQKMVALLIEGMKEQQQQIDDLREEIRLMKE